MATTGDVQVGDVGTRYKARITDAGVAFDVSSATVAQLIWRPPAAAAIRRDATITQDGTDWFLEYVVGVDEEDFHTRRGLWHWQGYVEFPDGQQYHTNIESYQVRGNLEG